MDNRCLANYEKILLSFKYFIGNKRYKIDKVTEEKEKCNKI